MPVPVAAQSKATLILSRSDTRIVGVNPARGMDICPRFSLLCWHVYVDASWWADPLSKESYRNVSKRFTLSDVNSESGQAREIDSKAERSLKLNQSYNTPIRKGPCLLIGPVAQLRGGEMWYMHRYCYDEIKSFPGDNLSTRHIAWTLLRLKPGLRCEKSDLNRMRILVFLRNRDLAR
jgi:hypothetical protein